MIFPASHYYKQTPTYLVHYITLALHLLFLLELETSISPDGLLISNNIKLSRSCNHCCCATTTLSSFVSSRCSMAYTCSSTSLPHLVCRPNTSIAGYQERARGVSGLDAEMGVASRLWRCIYIPDIDPS